MVVVNSTMTYNVDPIIHCPTQYNIKCHSGEGKMRDYHQQIRGKSSLQTSRDVIDINNNYIIIIQCGLIYVVVRGGGCSVLVMSAMFGRMRC